MKKDMKTKALFLDIDGTLVSFRTHQVPHSAVEALSEARRRGVKVFTATGRPMPLIRESLREICNMMDGYVMVNGARCVIGDKVVSENAIPQEDVEGMIRMADKHNICTFVVGEDEIYMYRHLPIYDELFRDGLGVKYEPKPYHPGMKLKVLQFSPFFGLDIEPEVLSLMPHSISARWNPRFTDIISAEADKGKGVAAIARALGIDISETMVFGDGGNDVSMLRAAGIGVAMGNANDDVKAQADYVTTSVDDDGVARALRHFNII